MRRQEFEEAAMVAVDISIVNRYFVRGLIENVNLEFSILAFLLGQLGKKGLFAFLF